MFLVRIVFFLFIALSSSAASLDFLRELTLISAPSGFEKPVREVIRAKWQNYMPDIHTDGIGNVIARDKGQKGPRILLMAHMDEVGLMVESVTQNGYLRVIPLGGIHSSVIFAHRWQIQTDKGTVIGYSGMDSPHLLAESEREQMPLGTNLFLDIGVGSAAEAEALGIRIGSPVTPVADWTALGSHRYLAKALDDRAGLAITTEILATRKANPNQLIAAATVQEEIGLRGATTIYPGATPDIVLNIEVGIADDYPLLIAKRKGRIQLGKGPTLFVYDRSMIPHQDLLNWIRTLAQKNNIPLQLEVETGYGEDGAKVQTSGEGVPVINIGLPVRYAHQEAGIFDQRDYDDTIRLIQLIVANFDDAALKTIRG